MTEPAGGNREVRLFVRETLPWPAAKRAEAVERRVESLAEGGVVDRFEVTHWDKRIAREDCTNTSARDLYNEFVSWAASEGVSLRPFFDTRECYSMETGEKGDWLVFPALCLAIYEGGELSSVYPHADGKTRRSVMDCLDEVIDTSLAKGKATAGTAD